MVDDLINREKIRIIEMYGPYNSAHEGYSVLAEEIEEAEDEMTAIRLNMESMWSRVRTDNLVGAKREARAIRKRALRLIAEAIQVAAVCDKFQELEAVYAVFNKEE